jgi:hypothetical protein
MATHPFARRQWLGFSALGCVLGASAASGVGTFSLVRTSMLQPGTLTRGTEGAADE